MIRQLKKIVSGNSKLMGLVASVFNIIHYNNAWRYKANNTIKYKAAFLKGTHFKINGHDNTIIIGPKARLTDCKFAIIGNNCKLLIGGR